MIDQKESIDLVVGIEEDQKAGIESHTSTGAKVGTENKIENLRRKVSLCDNLIQQETLFILLSPLTHFSLDAGRVPFQAILLFT